MASRDIDPDNQQPWRCFACSTPVRPGMGDWCRCIPVGREEWSRLQREANPKLHPPARGEGGESK